MNLIKIGKLNQLIEKTKLQNKTKIRNYKFVKIEETLEKLESIK